jgi:hypothetical protein
LGQLNQFVNTVEPNHCDRGALNFMLQQLTGRSHCSKPKTPSNVLKLKTVKPKLSFCRLLLHVASTSATFLANMIDCSSDDTMRYNASML